MTPLPSLREVGTYNLYSYGSGSKVPQTSLRREEGVVIESSQHVYVRLDWKNGFGSSTALWSRRCCTYCTFQDGMTHATTPQRLRHLLLNPNTFMHPNDSNILNPNSNRFSQPLCLWCCSCPLSSANQLPPVSNVSTNISNRT